MKFIVCLFALASCLTLAGCTSNEEKEEQAYVSYDRGKNAAAKEATAACKNKQGLQDMQWNLQRPFDTESNEVRVISLCKDGSLGIKIQRKGTRDKENQKAVALANRGCNNKIDGFTFEWLRGTIGPDIHATVVCKSQAVIEFVVE